MAQSGTELEVKRMTPTELEAPLSTEDMIAMSKADTPENKTLRGLTSLDDVFRFIESEYGGIIDVSDEIGDGFAMIEDKGQLVGKEMALINWKIVDGDHGTFVFVRAMTRDEQRVMFIDGSTGICDQLLELSSRTGRFGGMHVKRGLRRSDYEYEDTDAKTGETKMKPATTFYLDTSL